MTPEIFSTLVFLFGITASSTIIGYAFGWHWRGRHEAKKAPQKVEKTSYSSRPMTPEEREKFDETFRRMRGVFDSMEDIFK